MGPTIYKELEFGNKSDNLLLDIHVNTTNTEALEKLGYFRSQAKQNAHVNEHYAFFKR